MRMKTPESFCTLFALVLAAACSATAPRPSNLPVASTEADADPSRAIEDLIHTFFAYVDAREWPKVEALMSTRVQVDYSELGGNQGEITARDLVVQWQSVLPGFDRTVHQPHNLAIWHAGDRATATLDAIATHVIFDDDETAYWSVYVGYDTEFVRSEGGWRMARIAVSLYDSAGDATLMQSAQTRVRQSQINPFQEASRARQPVEQFFASLEAGNLEALLSVLAPSVVQEMPFAPAGFPKELNGLDEIRAQYGSVIDYAQRYPREFLPTRDPNRILVKFRGEITTSDGTPYNNAYVSLFSVDREGKIIRIVEQFSPKILLTGWPGLKPATYSVHDAGASTNSGIEQRDARFDSKGVTLAGRLFLPPGFDKSKRYPAAVVTGSWTSVKEQMPDAYASLLAEQGIVALSFDFRGFGQSGGQIRQLEKASFKIADIRAAAGYLLEQPGVDPERLTALGVCASSGYVAHAAAQDSAIKTVVLVAPWLHDPSIARSLYDSRPGGTDGLLARSDEAQARFDTTGEVSYVLAASELDPMAAMYVPGDVFDYYLNPAKAAGPHYDNRFAVMGWRPWLTFDAISVAADLRQPVFIVHSESGAVPHGAKTFYDRLPGEKDIVWLNAFTQQDLYAEPEAVRQAVAAVTGYLKQ
ncbi:MAG: alpha/beta fold hydrolase [Myxococcota bacterium]